MKTYKAHVLKKFSVLILVFAIMLTMMPLAPDGMAYAASTGTFKYGSTVKDASGGEYHWKYSQMAPAYWWDASGHRITDPECTYESASAGIERFTIKTNGKTKSGYCVAHGIKVDPSTTLTAKNIDSWVHTAAYPESSKKGIQYAMIYGYQDERDIRELEKDGFAKSKYYQKHASKYSDGDWYIATQILVWEYQQLIRTDSVAGEPLGRHENGLNLKGGKDHYFNVIKGRAAADIYEYMALKIKSHREIAGFAKKTKDDAEKSSYKGLAMQDDGNGTYTCTVKDTNGKFDELISASGTSKDKWKVTKSGQNYTFTFTGKLKEDGTVYKFDKIIPLQDSWKGGNMMIWSWSSSGSLRQAVSTGVDTEPISMYIKFYPGKPDKPDKPTEGKEREEPEFFPHFEFPVEKIDHNPGWDGDVHTGMGDASLAATYVLERSLAGGSWEEVDSVTLDEFGMQEILCDQPWTDVNDFTLSESIDKHHEESDGEGNVTHSCDFGPTRAEWTGHVEYRIREISVPSGRFMEPDSGIREGYTADYYAVTDDTRECGDEPENWTEIEYTLTYADPYGTDETVTGTMGEGGIEIDGVFGFSAVTFVNDCYRGRIFISKSNENEDVFNEEGSSGVQHYSKNSKWKMHLDSGGWEEHPYISFVEDGLTEEGTRKYRVVRDTSGTDNAVTELTVGKNGCIYIYDIPYGNYVIDEVAADDESFVLESFKQMVDEHDNGYFPNDPDKDNRYHWNLRNKKKENVIKIVKTDAETGKPVQLRGTKFYLRYMGNPLLQDPSKSPNYGRLLPNASDINSASKDYTFVCNSNGEIVLPYDLEFGTYRVEEFLLPDGYFVGKYNSTGKGTSADYGESGEYGKDDDGKAGPGMGFDDLVAVYDKDGKHVEYKAGDIFNYYTFNVEKQNSHMNGDDYEKYYKAVAMKNNPVKGKIEIEKEGEVLVGFEKAEKNGFTVWTPKYVYEKLKGAVFGIFAAIDEWKNDGSDGASLYDSDTDSRLTIPTDKKTHSGVNGKGEIYEEGILNHESGAKIYEKKLREASANNHFTRVYTTPEQRPTTYHYQIERRENGLKYLYHLEAEMRYNAGGSNFTTVNVTKVTSAENGYAVDIPTTDATSVVGGVSYNPAVNVSDAEGNVFDISKDIKVFEADGKKIYDAEGKFIADLADIGTSRYLVKDYNFYKLTEEDLVMEEKTVDGGFDSDEEQEPAIETKTHYEWENGCELVNPQIGGRAVIKVGEDYSVETTGYYEGTKEVNFAQCIRCDENGVPVPQYTVPDGWMELPYIPEFTEDEGIISVENPHYAMISTVIGDTVCYRILLEDGRTWQDCTAEGNFQKMVVEEYIAKYTQAAGSDRGFTFELDGITVSSQAIGGDKTATTIIDSPFDVKADIALGIGYTQNTEGNTTVFTAKEPSAPVYFLSDDGVRTEMYLYGDTTKTLLTIPMEAVEANYERIVPGIVFTRTGEVIDWYSKLSPDNPVFHREAAAGNTVTATRHEGGKDSDVYYTVEILSNQTMGGETDGSEANGPFEITYADGYTAKFYKDKSEAGNDVGVMIIDGIYKTSTAALSDLVEMTTTDEDGMATSSELPLGRYIVRELSAPHGWTADTEKAWNVKLEYKDRFTPLVWDAVKAYNEYFNVEIDLSKVFETEPNSKQYVKASGAVFGLYNAEPIEYGTKRLKEDTLLDTFAVNDEGKVVSEVKIPEGVYYLKEIKTREGYNLNETPFYFVAGDKVKSEPLYISKDADGQDFDGLTAKAVMDGAGRARITIETLTRKPVAEMQINGKVYKLDESIKEADENGVTNKVLKDMSRTVISVTEEAPVGITLANGKILTLKVMGNTYTYSYDGNEGQYIPTIVNTGYYAEFLLKEQQEDKNNPKDKNMVLNAAEDTSAVTVETVHEKQQKVKEGTGIDNDGDGLFDKEGEIPPEYVDVLDQDGNPVFDHYAEISLSKGNLERAVLGDEEIQLDAPEFTGKITLKREETLRLGADDGARYMIKMDKDGHIKVSVNHTVDGALTGENAPKLTIDGKPVTEGFFTAKNITAARQDSSAKTVQVKINTLDNLNSSEIENDAFKKPDKPLQPNEPTPPGPKPQKPIIGTSASHTSEGVITDIVFYKHLIPGKTYTLKGVLMDKEKESETKVTAEKTFVPENADGSTELEFQFKEADYYGKTLVVFESLYIEEELIAKHQDFNDKNQTVKIDEPKPQQPDKPGKPDVPKQPKPEKPKTPESPQIPKTGDHNLYSLYILVTLISLVLITILMAAERRKYKKDGNNHKLKL